MKYLNMDKDDKGELPVDELWINVKKIFRKPVHLEIVKSVMDYITVLFTFNLRMSKEWQSMNDLHI
jgi:hypothetical protein